MPGASATLIGGISGIAYGNDTLFVADSNRFGSYGAPDGNGNPGLNNNRVLVFNKPVQHHPPARPPTSPLLPIPAPSAGRGVPRAGPAGFTTLPLSSVPTAINMRGPDRGCH